MKEKIGPMLAPHYHTYKNASPTFYKSRIHLPEPLVQYGRLAVNLLLFPIQEPDLVVNVGQPVVPAAGRHAPLANDHRRRFLLRAG